jgi:hypothetical protein
MAELESTETYKVEEDGWRLGKKRSLVAVHIGPH